MRKDSTCIERASGTRKRGTSRISTSAMPDVDSCIMALHFCGKGLTDEKPAISPMMFVRPSCLKVTQPQDPTSIRANRFDPMLT